MALVCLQGSRGHERLLVLLAAPLVLLLANGFMVVRALLRREYDLALWYFLVVVGAAALFTAIEVPGKIGG